MFEEILKHVKDQLDELSEPYELSDLLKKSSLHLYEIMVTTEGENVKDINAATEEFHAMNYLKWKDGFQKLECFFKFQLKQARSFKSTFCPFQNLKPTHCLAF